MSFLFYNNGHPPIQYIFYVLINPSEPQQPPTGLKGMFSLKKKKSLKIAIKKKWSPDFYIYDCPWSNHVKK